MLLKNKTILVIDDTASIRVFLRILLRSQGAIYHESATASQGIRLCRSICPDLVILDLCLPDRNGLDILAELKRNDTPIAAPAIIILSANKEQHIEDKARRLGADGYLCKPFLVEELLELMVAVFKLAD